MTTIDDCPPLLTATYITHTGECLIIIVDLPQNLLIYILWASSKMMTNKYIIPSRTLVRRIKYTIVVGSRSTWNTSLGWCVYHIYFVIHTFKIIIYITMYQIIYLIFSIIWNLKTFIFIQLRGTIIVIMLFKKFKKLINKDQYGTTTIQWSFIIFSTR